MTIVHIPGALECLDEPNPDELAVINSVCIDCFLPHAAVLCLACHQARDRAEREGLQKTAYAAADEMVRLRARISRLEREKAEAEAERDESRQLLESLTCQTFDLPFLGRRFYK